MNMAPILPSLALMDWSRHLLWAVVLVWALLALRQTFWPGEPRTPWLAAAVALAVWTLWPGTASPAWWLGLAFQSPSLMTAGLCAMLLWRWLRPAAAPQTTLHEARPSTAHLWLAAAGVLLGWVLLLDTLALTPAWLPGSIYAQGFGPWPLWLLLALGAGLWALGDKIFAIIFIATALAFTLTRLPNGNIFDAILDPWLWVALHGALLRALMRPRV